MLKSWSIENFKPIVNSGELKLAPVTVLAGRNNSGKSSLLQSILMISQTLSNPVPDRPLILNGALVQLGTFEDILSEFSSSRNMLLKFGLSYEQDELGQDPINFNRSSNYKIAAIFRKTNSNDTSSSAIEASKVTIEGVSLEISFEYDLPISEPSQEEKRETVTFRSNFVVTRMPADEIKILRESTAGYPRFVPYIVEKHNYLGELTSSNNKASNEGRSNQFLVALSHFLPTNLIREVKEDHELVENKSVGEIDLEAAVEQITRFFSSQIRYLGPLRVDPWATQQRFAPTSELDDVGAKGEYAAVVYHYNQLASIQWYNPEAHQIEQGTLKEALDTWAQYLGIAHQVTTEEAGQLGVMWKVVLKEGQKPRALPEVGGGVNHALPILMMGLLAPGNTLLIIEEPEVTLHPGVQARLGDFFVGLTKCKKQCLIETHSENLVSQLRYHIVQAGGQDKSDCIIYFVDQDEKGAAKFEPVEISPRGNILNWPEGFFDETMLQEDRITAASLKKRAQLAKND